MIKLQSNGRIIEGTAIVFNSQSELLQGVFTEIIKPDAINVDLIKSSDILMLYNHSDKNGVLARSKQGRGTLKIKYDKNGVYYSFKVPNTTLGNDVLEMVKRGDLTSSSFAFDVDEQSQTWEKRSDGTYLRTIYKIKNLYDFSIVPIPAYQKTNVSNRSNRNKIDIKTIEPTPFLSYVLTKRGIEQKLTK